MIDHLYPVILNPDWETRVDKLNAAAPDLASALLMFFAGCGRRDKRWPAAHAALLKAAVIAPPDVLLCSEIRFIPTVDSDDVVELAESITKNGSRPIVVTKNRLGNWTLVFGEHQLVAVRDVLKRETIETRDIDVRTYARDGVLPSGGSGDFTQDEHIAVTKAVREELSSHGSRLYFIRESGGVGPIKIGCSRKIAQRLAGLQSGSPVILEILADIHGGHGLERMLHYDFAKHRLHGEWFEPCPELLALIDKINGG